MSGGATDRIYYTDAYLSEFTARVVDRADEGRRVYLDRTAFYPTSGGQQHDTGILGASNVLEVVDEDDRVAHLLDVPLQDDAVRGMIHWDRRFDHMQQHTGQHLLSAIFEDLFGAKTVSVHFGDATSTLDVMTDGLPAESIERTERRANEVVVENRPVTIGFEDAATAKGLRKAVDRAGSLRVVTIADLDRSACGGTHVRATGEIGSIMIRGTERVRKSLRVEFVCGFRGVARARADFTALGAIASTLSTSPDAAPDLVSAQSHQAKENEQARRRLERELARYRAVEMHAAATPLASGLRLIVVENGGSIDQLKTLGQALLDREQVVFAGTTKDGGLLVAASEDSSHDAGGLLREALTAVGGKGGGSPRLAQGSAAAGKAGDAIAFIRGALARDR